MHQREMTALSLNPVEGCQSAADKLLRRMLQGARHQRPLALEEAQNEGSLALVEISLHGVDEMCIRLTVVGRTAFLEKMSHFQIYSLETTHTVASPGVRLQSQRATTLLQVKQYTTRNAA